MDFHALQKKLFELDPTDPREDLARLKAQASNNAVTAVAPTKDYVNESVEVPQGSMPLELDSIVDFAKLAGLQLTETQRTGSAGQAKGSDPLPAKSKPSRTGEQRHPLRNKLVGENDQLSERMYNGNDQRLAADLDTLFRLLSNVMGRVSQLEGRTPPRPGDTLQSVPRDNSIDSIDNLRSIESITRDTSDIKQRLYAALAKKGIR